MGGPLAELRGVRLLSTGAVEAFFVGSAVPPDIAKALKAARTSAGTWNTPAAPPLALVACQRLLTAQGWNVKSGSTSLVYLIEPGVSCSVDATFERSDRAIPRWMRGANPHSKWHPVEWNELLDGRLGPWAMATCGRRVVSFCHTPAPMTDRSAECGVWTDPAFRGRGYAAAATAQWAELVGRSGRYLFYGTDFDNVSSQRVTERLKLRFLGYHRGLREVGNEVESDLHPLSELHPSSAPQQKRARE